MTSVGIRELRQRASELLRLVQRGETVEITDRGRPVALLTPYPSQGPLAFLRAAGQTEPAEGSIDTLPVAIELEPSCERPSQILERRRLDER